MGKLWGYSAVDRRWLKRCWKQVLAEGFRDEPGDASRLRRPVEHRPRLWNIIGYQPMQYPKDKPKG